MRVAFRADASMVIGTGHIMRCLALAEALRSLGASCVFVMRNHTGHLADRITAKGFALRLLDPPAGKEFTAPPKYANWAGVTWQQDAEETKLAIGQNTDWIVVDHYAFDSRWQKAVIKPGMRLMVIDDLADRSHEADLLLDQNLGRKAADYNGLVPQRCRRLIGPGYALLRQEFVDGRAASLDRRLVRSPKHIAIMMGGIDANDATSIVLRALRNARLPNDVRLTVVMGSCAPALEQVKNLAANMPWPTNVLTDVEDMPTLMSNADVSIGAGGGTTWERCCMGLPSIVIETAHNQNLSVRALVSNSLSLGMGFIQSEDFHERLCKAIEFHFNDNDMREQRIATTASYCDGQGAIRVCKYLFTDENSRIEVGEEYKFKVREASILDMRDIWLWRCAEVNLSYYRSNIMPSLLDHITWFREAITDPKRWLTIVELGSVPAAHVRFDTAKGDKTEVEVSICINPMYRGRGLGRGILEAAIIEATKHDVRCFCAEVHAANRISQRIFLKAGFREVGTRKGFIQMQLNIA